MAYGNGSAIGQMNAMQGSSAGYDSPQVAPRLPLISVELDRQEKTVAQLHNIISDLESRLSPVTRPGGIDGGQVDKAAPPPSVPLAGNLSDQNGKLEAACARLLSIFERIEL